MNDNNVLSLVVVFRSLGAVISVIGAIFLMYYGKTGWGWLIFLAICLGSFSVSTKSDNGIDVD